MTMGFIRPSFRGIFSINVAIASCFGLLVFNWAIQPALCADWDSETFLKELEAIDGKDRELFERGKEDREWATYLDEIAPTYDEFGFPEVTTNDPEDNFFSQNLNWSLTGRGEVPYLAVIYQLFDNEREEDEGAMWGVRQARSCGGVLVSTERLITICVCVASYFASIIWQTEIARINTFSTYDYDLGMRSAGGAYQFDGKLNRIYVQYGSNRYFAGPNMPGLKDPKNDRHLVDSKENEMGGDIPRVTHLQYCGKLVEEAWKDGKLPVDGPDGRPTNYFKMRDSLALVPFWPIISHPTPGQFVPWPPKPFSDQHTINKLSLQHEKEEQVIVTGIGFEKNDAACMKRWKILDDDGEDIPLQKQAINLPYVHCVNAVRDKFFCRGRSADERYNKLSCFCDLHQPDVIGQTECKTITGGVLGWPIIWRGSVVALTASPRSLTEKGNRILGSSLYWDQFRKHVEETLTVEKIEIQRTERPPMFREDVVPENMNFVFYDYPDHPEWFVHGGTTPKLIPYSLAVHVSPQHMTSVLAPVVSAFMHLTSH